jgi:hypothetical protein
MAFCSFFTDGRSYLRSSPALRLASLYVVGEGVLTAAVLACGFAASRRGGASCGIASLEDTLTSQHRSVTAAALCAAGLRPIPLFHGRAGLRSARSRACREWIRAPCIARSRTRARCLGRVPHLEGRRRGSSKAAIPQLAPPRRGAAKRQARTAAVRIPSAVPAKMQSWRLKTQRAALAGVLCREREVSFSASELVATISASIGAPPRRTT